MYRNKNYIILIIYINIITTYFYIKIHLRIKLLRIAFENYFLLMDTILD